MGSSSSLTIYGMAAIHNRWIGHRRYHPVVERHLTASLFVGCGVAGISSVATLPAFRRRGIGTAVAAAPLRVARQSGYRIGVLFSAPVAVEMYRKLGFVECGKGNCYAWEPPPV